jgi:hypothetical protein
MSNIWFPASRSSTSQTIERRVLALKWRSSRMLGYLAVLAAVMCGLAQLPPWKSALQLWPSWRCLRSSTAGRLRVLNTSGYWGESTAP